MGVLGVGLRGDSCPPPLPPPQVISRLTASKCQIRAKGRARPWLRNAVLSRPGAAGFIFAINADIYIFYVFKKSADRKASYV